MNTLTIGFVYYLRHILAVLVYLPSYFCLDAGFTVLLVYGGASLGRDGIKKWFRGNYLAEPITDSY